MRYARHACRVRKAQHNSAVKAFGNNKKPVSGSFFLLTGFFIHSFAPAELPLLFLIPIQAGMAVASRVLFIAFKIRKRRTHSADGNTDKTCGFLRC